MAWADRYKPKTVRQQVMRCKEAAALQLALLRAEKDGGEQTMRWAKRIADSARRLDAVAEARRQKRRKKAQAAVAAAGGEPRSGCETTEAETAATTHQPSRGRH
jgi:hypothetical protein